MSKVKLTIQNTPLNNYRENGCKRSAQGSLGSFGLKNIGRQYSNAANNQLSFVYVFSIHTIPGVFEPNVPYLFALILHFIYSRGMAMVQAWDVAIFGIDWVDKR